MVSRQIIIRHKNPTSITIYYVHVNRINVSWFDRQPIILNTSHSRFWINTTIDSLYASILINSAGKSSILRSLRYEPQTIQAKLCGSNAAVLSISIPLSAGFAAGLTPVNSLQDFLSQKPQCLLLFSLLTYSFDFFYLSGVKNNKSSTHDTNPFEKMFSP